MNPTKPHYMWNQLLSPKTHPPTQNTRLSKSWNATIISLSHKHKISNLNKSVKLKPNWADLLIASSPANQKKPKPSFYSNKLLITSETSCTQIKMQERPAYQHWHTSFLPKKSWESSATATAESQLGHLGTNEGRNILSTIRSHQLLSKEQRHADTFGYNSDRISIV